MGEKSQTYTVMFDSVQIQILKLMNGQHKFNQKTQRPLFFYKLMDKCYIKKSGQELPKHIQ